MQNAVGCGVALPRSRIHECHSHSLHDEHTQDSAAGVRFILHGTRCGMLTKNVPHANAKAHMNFKPTRVEVHLCHRHAMRVNYLLRLLRKGRRAGLRDESLEKVHSFEQEDGTSAYLAWLSYCSGRVNRNSESNKLLSARP